MRDPAIRSHAEGKQDRTQDCEWEAVFRLPGIGLGGSVAERDVDAVEEGVAHEHAKERTHAEDDESCACFRRVEAVGFLQDRGQADAHHIEERKGDRGLQGERHEDPGAEEDSEGACKCGPDLLEVFMAASRYKRFRFEFAAFALQAGDPAVQDGHLVGLTEAGQKEDLGDDGEARGHEEDLSPAKGLGDGACDCGTDCTADERGEGDQTHC